MNALTNVHIYHEEWAKFLMESKNHLEFQRLWELVMIRSSSMAICERVGSIMGQHCAKGHYLDSESFSKELVLNFNFWEEIIQFSDFP